MAEDTELERRVAVLDTDHPRSARTTGLARQYYEEGSLPHTVTTRLSVAPDPTLPLGAVTRDGTPDERRLRHPYARLPYS